MVTLCKGYAQDPRFSQYFSAPLLLNPAYTGAYDGYHRAASNFRSQSQGVGIPFTTMALSYDGTIRNDNWEPSRLGAGVVFMNDRTGNGSYTGNYLAASGAYHQALDQFGTQHLSIGGQVAFGTHLLDAGRYAFNNQFTGLGFDLSAPSGEASIARRASYIDVNAGLLFTHDDDLNRFHAGISVFHLNRPSYSFTGHDPARLQSRLTVHGGYARVLSAQAEVFVSGQYMQQAGNKQLSAGLAYGRTFSDDRNSIALYAGLWYRGGDAVYPYLSIRMMDFQLGMSYDILTSSLAAAGARNRSFEISLAYMIGESELLKKAIPWY